MTDFLNKSAIETLPPSKWRESKVIPLYKGKGDASNMANYRSIAISPPFAKLFMAVISKRLTTISTTRNLHAETQAGFRPHHTTVE